MKGMEQIAVKSASKGNFKATTLVLVPLIPEYLGLLLNEKSNDDLIFMTRISKDALANVTIDEVNTAYDIACIQQEYKIELQACKQRGITHMV